MELDLHKVMSLLVAELSISAARFGDVSRALHRLTDDLKACMREADMLQSDEQGKTVSSELHPPLELPADPFTYPLWKSHD